MDAMTQHVWSRWVLLKEKPRHPKLMRLVLGITLGWQQPWDTPLLSIQPTFLSLSVWFLTGLHQWVLSRNPKCDRKRSKCAEKALVTPEFPFVTSQSNFPPQSVRRHACPFPQMSLYQFQFYRPWSRPGQNISQILILQFSNHLVNKKPAGAKKKIRWMSQIDFLHVLEGKRGWWFCMVVCPWRSLELDDNWYISAVAVAFDAPLVEAETHCSVFFRKIECFGRLF